MKNRLNAQIKTVCENDCDEENGDLLLFELTKQFKKVD